MPCKEYAPFPPKGTSLNISNTNRKFIMSLTKMGKIAEIVNFGRILKCLCRIDMFAHGNYDGCIFNALCIIYNSISSRHKCSA